VGITVIEVFKTMKCDHKNKKFITFIDYRGYPERLFICQDCGITISDYMHEEEIDNGDIDSSFQATTEDDIFDRYGDEYRHLHNGIL